MDQETSQALEKSIEHWHRLATGTQEDDETIYGNYCALCDKFRSGRDTCDGCPVKKRTGHDGCIGSPWNNAFKEYDLYEDEQSEKFKQAALKMYEFLCSLRESNDTQRTDDSTSSEVVS